MEARQTLREISVPKGIVVVLAISVAVALAAAGTAVAKDLAGSGAPAATTYHAAPGTVLRQDNPVQGSSLIDRGAERGSQVAPAAGIHNGRSAGTQIVGDNPGLDAGDYGPSSDLTRALPTQSAGYDGWDARSVREGHGV
jgi:hypothetical protein